MSTAPEIYRTIEEVVESYAEKKFAELISPHVMEDATLHVSRGKLMATKELIGILRNALGYDPKLL